MEDVPYFVSFVFSICFFETRLEWLFTALWLKILFFWDMVLHLANWIPVFQGNIVSPVISIDWS